MLIGALEVAELLGVPEATVFAWTRRGEIPFTRVQEQYRFNRAEILAWATARGMAISPRLFPADAAAPAAGTSLAEALREGGVHADVHGADRATVMRALAALLPLPPGTDRELVCEFLLASEALGATGIGDGIALPHVASPIVLRVPRPFVTLCYLATPVDFGAHDGRPVTTLFSIVAPHNRIHLELLARVAAALHDPPFRAALARRAPAAEILAAARLLDAAALPGRPTPPSEPAY
ncbi:MAG: PTS sugar transporter subunit IIA [Polyangiaceae bacterium]|nr:PTS sugar transporter subunit IIA [Polyangiaceae bacterium]